MKFNELQKGLYDKEKLRLQIEESKQREWYKILHNEGIKMIGDKHGSNIL